MHPARPMRLFSTTWDEGRYFDLWMIVHFLSGVAGGLSNALFGLTSRGVYALGVSLLVAWEVIEYVRGVNESWPNRTLDLALGIAGIMVAIRFAGLLTRPMELLAFGVTTTVVLSGSVRGWLAFKERERRAASTDALTDRASSIGGPTRASP